MKHVCAILVGFFVIGMTAQAKTVRATDLGSNIWSEISNKTASEIIIEFRQGDELPVSFSADGDLFETTQSSVGHIGIKRNFWIKLEQNKILISLDNLVFKEISELISGSFEAGTGADQSGGLANTLSLALKAHLK